MPHTKATFRHLRPGTLYHVTNGSVMLEVLLMQYREIFGEDFPLLQFEGKQEIEVINILYDCVSKCLPYDPERKIDYRITEAPGLKK